MVYYTIDLIFRYNEGEIHFSLMAIVPDKKILFENKIQQILKQMEDSGMETDAQQSEVAQLRLLVEKEESKIRKYQIENIRRKHNYLPLIVEILKILAKEGKLMPLYEKAKERSMDSKTKKIKS